MHGLQIRRVLESDWRALRETRLRALADAPDAFCSTLDREAAFGDADWREWARDAATGNEETCLLAWVAGRPAGIVAACAEEGHDQVHLISMWVAPESRHAGIGRALVDAITAWAIDIGAASVRLDVAVGNPEARQLYETSGFSPTGRSGQYDDRPGLTTVELERPAQ